jgi:hypothetical protein
MSSAAEAFHMGLQNLLESPRYTVNEAYGGRARVCISICLHTSPSDGCPARNQESGWSVDSSMGKAWLFKWPACAASAITCYPHGARPCTTLRKAKCQCGLLTPNRPKPDLLALRARSSPLEEMALDQRCWSKHDFRVGDLTGMIGGWELNLLTLPRSEHWSS